MKKRLRKILIVFLWLCIWQLAALGIDNDILLAGPVEVGGTLLKLLTEAEFYQICLTSLGRILAGFCLAFLSGVLLGVLSYRFSVIKEIVEPILAVMKSIPVASFVVLLLIWQGAENLSVWISFLVVFPNACVSTENGLKAVDPKLEEMAEVFGIKGIQRAIYIARPTVLAYLVSGMEISIGLAFKSGVAAEVIGVPEFSIGERIYMSKIYLDTPGLFAWTFALIGMSFLMEKLILALLKMCGCPIAVRKSGKVAGVSFSGDKTEDKAASTEAERTTILIQGISKSFGEKQVLQAVTREIAVGECILLMGESGSGKTTLLRIIAGLEKPDVGEVTSTETAYLFQEDRLLENEFTITNIMLTAQKGGSSAKENKISTHSIEQVAEEILPKECLYKQAATLSGGMKRRLALIRTLLYGLDDVHTLILLDEPFAGLDEETKKRTVAFINKYRNGRTMIVATHDETDAELLGGNIWNIQNQRLESH